jgi:hypothetical protein
MAFRSGLLITFRVALCAIVVLFCEDKVLLMVASRAAVVERRCMAGSTARINDDTAQILAVRVDPRDGMVEGFDLFKIFYMA